jgi:putative aldouronate transport system substrate-binding protein
VEKSCGRWRKRKTAAVLLVLLMIVCMGCKVSNSEDLHEQSNQSEKLSVSNYTETLVVDFFSEPGNYMGKQAGWYGELIKEKFNIELNIISPNVSGGRDALFRTRYAAGDVGDIVVLSRENARKCIEAGLLADLTEYVETSTWLGKFQKGMDELAKSFETEGIYVIPAQASPDLDAESSPYFYGTNPEDGAYLRFDLFDEIGAPELDTFEDLLNALSEMQERFPNGDAWEKTYGFSFFRDWDKNNMKMADSLIRQMGFSMDETGFLMVNGDALTAVPVDDETGAYYRALEILFTANQMGLVDPESSFQTWNDYLVKIRRGAVLYSPWPWASVEYYNTDEKVSKNSGYAFVPVNECRYWTESYSPYGRSGNVFAVGSKCGNIDRVMEFLDWYASPENTECALGCMGPENYLWEMEDGKPVPNQEGVKFLKQLQDYQAPESLGSGRFRDGCIQTNALIWDIGAVNPNTGEPFSYMFWSSIAQQNDSLLAQRWSDRYGEDSPKDYLLNHNAIEFSPACLVSYPVESDGMNAMRAACETALIGASWDMVFASDREEFDRIWSNLKREMYSLGYEQCLEWDRQKVELLRNAKEQVMKTEG